MSVPSDAPPCTICGKPVVPGGKPGQKSFAPFCSGRCADIDLGRWLKGGYAIPGAPAEEAEEGPATPGQDPENE